MYPILGACSVDNYPAPKLRDYVIDRRLGTGTYAIVYKATSTKNNEIVAIKCIKKNGLNKTSTENLLREIKILKNIKQEYIVQLKDFQWDESYIYLIMEYCSGGDLSTFIKSRRTIPEKYVRRFVQQIACALKHLHSKGIAHMDLKPQNILLTSTNNPSLKLADFGFAQYMRENKQSRSLRGSPLYMAPEILKCKVYDSKVDLWSVGVILYEVIFGYAPFVSSTIDELEKKILDDVSIQIPSHVMLSETCKDLLRRLLQRNPLQRITFVEFFNHPFVDLEHMASNMSYPKAIELLTKAVKADENKLFLIAQRYYLQAIEYIIPAIQFEKDSAKKQEIREKAKIYLKRAEEIAKQMKTDTGNVVSNPKPKQQTTQNTLPSVETDESFSKLKISNIQPIGQATTTTQTDPRQNLLRHFSGQKSVEEAISMCFDADAIIADSENLEKLLVQYEVAISRLLSLFKSNSMSKECESLFKLNVDRWITRMESLQLQFNTECGSGSKSLINQVEEEDNNSQLKQCIVQ